MGYYQANEMCDDLELGPFGKTIADKIRAQCKQAAVLVVRTAAHLFPAPIQLTFSPAPARADRRGQDAPHGGEPAARVHPWQRADTDARRAYGVARAAGAMSRARCVLLHLVCRPLFFRPRTPAALPPAGVQHAVVDFDEHLDDAKKDWFNTGLLS